jgi:ApbE superfamily uncharacterized protein (UPF0280 family)
MSGAPDARRAYPLTVMKRTSSYRRLVCSSHLTAFQVVVKETDLQIHTEKPLPQLAKELVLKYRAQLESYIDRYPEFAATLVPWQAPDPVPQLIGDMIRAGRKAGVGPMAAVAGAIAESVGRDLLAHSAEVIVENGGDIFLKTRRPLTVGIYAGKSRLSLKLGLELEPGDRPMGICTSSGTVGHSLSFGKADAVCALAGSCALADAAATAVGNQVKSSADIRTGVTFGRQIDGVTGLVIIVGDRIGLWGQVQLVPLTRKKG